MFSKFKILGNKKKITEEEKIKIRFVANLKEFLNNSELVIDQSDLRHLPNVTFKNAHHEFKYTWTSKLNTTVHSSFDNELIPVEYDEDIRKMIIPIIDRMKREKVERLIYNMRKDPKELYSEIITNGHITQNKKQTNQWIVQFSHNDTTLTHVWNIETGNVEHTMIEASYISNSFSPDIHTMIINELDRRNESKHISESK